MVTTQSSCVCVGTPSQPVTWPSAGLNFMAQWSNTPLSPRPPCRYSGGHQGPARQAGLRPGHLPHPQPQPAHPGKRGLDVFLWAHQSVWAALASAWGRQQHKCGPPVPAVVHAYRQRGHQVLTKSALLSPVSFFLTCVRFLHVLQDEVLALAFWHTPRGKWWPVEVRPARGMALAAGSCALLVTALCHTRLLRTHTCRFGFSLCSSESCFPVSSRAHGTVKQLRGR